MEVFSTGGAEMTTKRDKAKATPTAPQPEPLKLVEAENLTKYKPKKRFTSSFASLLNGYADQIDKEVERIIHL